MGNIGPRSSGVSSISESGSYASPNLITTAITLSSAALLRCYVAGSGGPVTAPTLTDGVYGQILYLVGTHDTNTVEINDAANILLSGPAVLKDGSIIQLQWITGLLKWVEEFRNEI